MPRLLGFQTARCSSFFPSCSKMSIDSLNAGFFIRFYVDLVEGEVLGGRYDYP